jgi:FkbM family methyltransferase
LESAGYRVYHRDVLPFGIEYTLDIGRLSETLRIPIRTFFDVGANVGQTSSLALASFQEAQVFAFEPHPATFTRLVESLGGNPRLKTYNFALGNKIGVVPFFEYSSSTLNSLVPDAQYPTRKAVTPREIRVECTTLDSFCESHSLQQIDVLKIDTEGCDLLVLQGAERMLSGERVRFVYLEFNDMSPRAGLTGGALTPISSFLARFGFRFVATYPDHMEFGDEIHVGANVLFVYPARSGSPSVATEAEPQREKLK